MVVFGSTRSYDSCPKMQSIEFGFAFPSPCSQSMICIVCVVLHTKRHHVDDTCPHCHTLKIHVAEHLSALPWVLSSSFGWTQVDCHRFTNVRTATDLKPRRMKDPAVHGAETRYVEGPKSTYPWTQPATSMLVSTATDFGHFIWPETCYQRHGSEGTLRA